MDVGDAGMCNMVTLSFLSIDFTCFVMTPAALQPGKGETRTTVASGQEKRGEKTMTGPGAADSERVSA